jgi:hypothetical protein
MRWKREGSDRETYEVSFHLLNLYLDSAEGFSQQFRFLRDRFHLYNSEVRGLVDGGYESRKNAE